MENKTRLYKKHQFLPYAFSFDAADFNMADLCDVLSCISLSILPKNNKWKKI